MRPRVCTAGSRPALEDLFVQTPVRCAISIDGWPLFALKLTGSRRTAVCLRSLASRETRRYVINCPALLLPERCPQSPSSTPGILRATGDTVKVKNFHLPFGRPDVTGATGVDLRRERRHGPARRAAIPRRRPAGDGGSVHAQHASRTTRERSAGSGWALVSAGLLGGRAPDTSRDPSCHEGFPDGAAVRPCLARRSGFVLPCFAGGPSRGASTASTDALGQLPDGGRRPRSGGRRPCSGGRRPRGGGRRPRGGARQHRRGGRTARGRPPLPPRRRNSSRGRPWRAGALSTTGMSRPVHGSSSVAVLLLLLLLLLKVSRMRRCGRVQR